MRWVVLFLFLVLVPHTLWASSFVKTSTVPTAVPYSESLIASIRITHDKVIMRPYKDDMVDVWGVDWDGDCQHKTGYMMVELAKLGVPSKAMRGYVGWVFNGKGKKPIYHAWLVVRIKKSDGRVLDIFVDPARKYIEFSHKAKGYYTAKPVVRLDD